MLRSNLHLHSILPLQRLFLYLLQEFPLRSATSSSIGGGLSAALHRMIQRPQHFVPLAVSYFKSPEFNLQV